MLPVALDLARIPILLAGHGASLEKRLAALEEAGATRVTAREFSSPDAPGWQAGFEEKLHPATVVMIAGLDRLVAEAMAGAARRLGKLVNAEDMNELCDFYFTANLRRGDLLIAVSTSGASPALARRVRDWLAERFGEEWERRVRDMAARRKTWKAGGAGMQEVKALSEAYIRERQWL